MSILSKLLKPNIEKLERKGDLEGLIKAIRHKNSEIRRNAAIALIKILTEQLKNKHLTAEERKGARTLLQKIFFYQMYADIFWSEYDDLISLIRKDKLDKIVEIGYPMLVPLMYSVLGFKNNFDAINVYSWRLNNLDCDNLENRVEIAAIGNITGMSTLGVVNEIILPVVNELRSRYFVSKERFRSEGLFDN
ncbi:MAG: hypothetical protein ACOC5T_09375 [Elusimicrobiota bacterium]